MKVLMMKKTRTMRTMKTTITKKIFRMKMTNFISPIYTITQSYTIRDQKKMKLH